MSTVGSKGNSLKARFAEAEAWMDQGLCRGVDPVVFFPTDGRGVEAACQICRSCPVQEQCLDYALTANECFGVWGATSERERARIHRRERRLRAERE